MFNYPFNFDKTTGRFIRRLNRFVIEAETEGHRVEAYLANPGRLWELLLPGSELLLVQSLRTGKIPYTVLACLKNGRPILLHTHLTNKVIRSLISDNWPGLFDNYRVVRTEPAWGRHRFDLLLEDRESGAEYYLEIKSSTLFSGAVAMFPDAVTKRGAAHLIKLQELAEQGIKTGCLFVVMNPEAEYFLPAYHIDSNFAHAFSTVHHAVELRAIAIGFEHSFTAVNFFKPLTIPFNLLNAELADRGAYLLLIRLDRERKIDVGKLGSFTFVSGYYVYSGSGMSNLRRRVDRHVRRTKQRHWHIDYLTAVADAVTPVPIVSSDRLECALAQDIRELSVRVLAGFGSSDCGCPGHLFYFAENPLHNRNFIELIQNYRIGRLEKMIELVSTQKRYF
jgi:sugar fermentation stimulation protein A